MLDEVEEHEVASFVGDEYLGAFSILVAAGNVALEEVVPRVRPLQAAGAVELDLLPLYGEQEKLPGLDEKQVDIVLILEAEDGATFDLLELADPQDIDCSLIGEAHDLVVIVPYDPYDFISGRHIGQVYL